MLFTRAGGVKGNDGKASPMTLVWTVVVLFSHPGAEPVARELVPQWDHLTRRECLLAAQWTAMKLTPVPDVSVTCRQRLRPPKQVFRVMWKDLK
jgi:hypothetical protein